MKYLFSILLISLVGLAYSQAIQIDSIDTIPSTCENNGEITVNASGGDSSGAGLQYALVAVSTQERPNQSSNNFSALPAGSYTVQVTDNAGTVVSEGDVIVEDQYDEPVITSIDITTAECPDQNEGTATVNITGGSATPLSYTLFDSGGNIVAGPQASPTFTNLPDGDYVAQVEDACEIVFNFGVTIDSSVADIDFRNFDRFERDCDSSTARFRMFDNINPTDYVLTDANGTIVDSGTINTGSQANITFPNEDGLTLTITDACGRVLNETLNEADYTINPEIVSGGCGSAIDFNTSRSLDCNAQYCYKLITETDFTCTSDPVTDILPEGDYDLQVIDCCGDVTNSTLSVPGILTPSISLSRLNNSCLDDTGGGRIQISDPGLNTVITFDGPPIPDFTTTDENGSQTLSADLAPGDTVPYQTLNDGRLRSNISNLPEGSYDFTITDECGFSQTVTLEIRPQDIRDYDLVVEVIQGCPGQSSIDIGITSENRYRSSSSTTELTLVDENGNVVFLSDDIDERDPLTNVPNLAPGTYTGTFTTHSNYNLDAFGSQCPQVITKEVVIAPYEPPILSKSEFYQCQGDVTVIANAEGVAPFQYAIREFGTTDFSPLQDDPQFTGLEEGKTYEVQAFDACGQNRIQIVTAEGVLGAPNIGATYDCENNANATFGIFTASEVFGANYEWTDAAGNIVSTEQELIVDPIIAGEVYTVSVSIPGEGSDCLAATSQISIPSTDCSVLPVTLIDFSAELALDQVLLSWKTAEEIDHDYFEIERQTDNVDQWIALGRVTGTGNTNNISEYQFTDHQVKNGVNYYRLKIVSTQGEVEYSNILQITFESNINEIRLYPNPVNETETITVYIPEQIDIDRYQVINNYGQPIVDNTIDGDYFSIFTSQLGSGVYYIVFFKNDQQLSRYSQKIVVR